MLFQNVYILLTLNTFDVVNNYFNNITLETWFVCWAQSKNDNLSLLQNSRFFFCFVFLLISQISTLQINYQFLTQK